MASLSSIYIKAETLKTLLDTVTTKGENGVELTISLNDESKSFERKDGTKSYQNASAWVSQTKEQREEKKDRYYVGNGKVFWTDGKITLAEREQAGGIEEAKVIPPQKDDLPF